ncbi:hypothetical protein OE810_08440 [Rhodobacteraceae bacterium XHP0102]|nr:hypothetical protein [Rhodobacteraceae bacterium XHP0102]
MSNKRKFGPDRSELWFRLAFSLVGIAALGGAIAYRGLPTGPAMAEIGLIAGGFFIGSAIWSARRLITRDHPE